MAREIGPLQAVAAPYRFENLRSLTKKEVTLWNWYCRTLPPEKEWRAWIADILGHLVQKPVGYQIRLVQSHLVETKFGEKVLNFGSKQEITLGRNPDSDVILTAGAIARKHARLFLKDEALHIEDLGGALGTYVWDTRLSERGPQRIRNGDQFTIFPYRFRVEVDCEWTAETDVGISQLGVDLITRGEHFRRTPPGLSAFILQAYPSREKTLVDVSPTFLHQICQRVYGPIGLHGTKSSVASDETLISFILFAILERINRSLQSSLRFTFVRGTEIGGEISKGISLQVLLRVGEVTGECRVFVPLSFLYNSDLNPPVDPTNCPPGLSWKFPISVAFVDLYPDEMEQVVTGDVLLVQQSPTLLMASKTGTGWTMTSLESNFTRFSLDKYVDGGLPVANNAETAPAPSQSALATLPLRLHVVLAEKEITLAQIQSFTPGTIVELEGVKFQPVQLMVNGRILGEGELVDVEGTLAVKVVRWRNS